MRAVVAGAGIAGLVTARQLGLAGWAVDLLEKSDRPRRDGYMMDFFGPGVEASQRIGLFPRLASVAYEVAGAEYVDAQGKVMSRVDYELFAHLAGGRVLSLLRPDLESSARDALDDVPAGRVRLHQGTRLADVATDADGRVPVATVPETRLPAADVLVGADGIHSEVRERLFGPERDYLRPLGMRAAAFIAQDAELSPRFRGRFVLTDTLDRTVGYYGLRADEVATFFVYRAGAEGSEAVHPAGRRLRHEFAGLSPTVDRLLDLCPPDPYDDVVAQVVMPTWTLGHTVLVGDACGAVSLLAGQGGSLAVAGAALLGDLLGPVGSPDGIGPALAEFERRWRPVIATGQASGRRAASTFLPRNRAQLLARRWVIRSTRLPGVDRLVARQVLRSIAT
jgi:2-polyprenyl-6-methoxyphenol hydroxylase-like FAD-dependent oxidoreductase